MVWLYFLSGGLALYSVETADVTQPFHITALVAISVCLVPATIEGLQLSERAANFSKKKRKI